MGEWVWGGGSWMPVVFPELWRFPHWRLNLSTSQPLSTGLPHSCPDSPWQSTHRTSEWLHYDSFVFSLQPEPAPGIVRRQRTLLVLCSEAETGLQAGRPLPNLFISAALGGLRSSHMLPGAGNAELQQSPLAGSGCSFLYGLLFLSPNAFAVAFDREALAFVISSWDLCPGLAVIIIEKGFLSLWWDSGV